MVRFYGPCCPPGRRGSHEAILVGRRPPTRDVRTTPPGTTRVALCRLMADGDVVAEGRHYRFSDRLMARQYRQDEGRSPTTRPWRGGWETALIDPAVTDSARRGALGAQLPALPLA